MNRYLSLVLLTSLLLLGCSSARNQPDSPSVSATQVSQAQELPVTATAQMGGETIELEVAKTRQQQALGLMFREEISDNRGMLFPFDPPRQVGFWMKNVEVPLDMVFLRDGVILEIAANVPPCHREPCPSYGPNEPIDQVIELRGGRAEELGLETGDRITVEFSP
ncbi:DUF192 domain-containing protein [Spirulina sp. CS-785/01]|uniref:DUF192 domain-containing protein n=1 Tax=Spirulina sp. CS-785/01 TaxID=3021716 RepID=UPI00232C810C|nr:DUF192 domain-containing protein [Spirulina sp. CS-785/01]MDB9315748.1 DUF192 domain-containing protein [Spirulina sp. CS-785/01]